MIFFNSSMPRSGSTLMQNLLAQHPEVHATPTDGSLELLYGARGNYGSSPEFKAQDPQRMLAAWRGFCKGGLDGYVAGLSAKPHTCIKSRGIGIHYQWYSAFMELKPKIICVVRDIRSILASMEKIFQANAERGDPIQNHASMTGTTIEKRVHVWLNSQPVGLALERFWEMTRTGVLDECCVVRYEDLTRDPKGTMERVWQYVGLPACTHDFDNVEQVTQEDDAVYGLSPTLHKIQTAVTPHDPDYRNILGKGLCDHVAKQVDWYQTLFKY